jgi:drug/metabolite transporter (DMT)-like permease
MALVTAWLLLGQTLNAAQIVGAVVLLGGAALVQLTSRTPQAGPDPLLPKPTGDQVDSAIG